MEDSFYFHKTIYCGEIPRCGMHLVVIFADHAISGCNPPGSLLTYSRKSSAIGILRVSVTSRLSEERSREFAGVVMFGVTALLFFAMVTDGYHVRDQATRPWDDAERAERACHAVCGNPGRAGRGRAVHSVRADFYLGAMLISHKPFGRVMPRLLGPGW